MTFIKQQLLIPDFNNTEIAFAHKTNCELRKAGWIFSIMNNPWFVKWSSKMALWAINNKIPLAETIIKKTIFDQFCGGTSIEDCQLTISQLANQNVFTVLDYGAEAKTTEEDFNGSMEELLHAIGFADTHQNIPVISMKITGLINIQTLEKIQANQTLTKKETASYQNLLKRLSFIGEAAEEKSVSLFVDAEESWIQDVIDDLVDDMMRKHNSDKAIIFNTFQMYRHDRLDFLKASFEKAKKDGYILGAKIVRGAYMEKERARSTEMGYDSPIQKNKAATDQDYNRALEFCVKNYHLMASFNATHNQESNMLQAEMILNENINFNHPHLNFCQLYGMSDQITFNLGDAGFNAMKYVPYGRVNEVIPYLIRRAQENTSVSGEMGREYQMLLKEMKRRKENKRK